MESVKKANYGDVPLVLNCNKIEIIAKEMWIELINIGFIEDDFNYMDIARLAYEDDIYIEHNDQINCLWAHYQDICFTLYGNCLTIDVTKSKDTYNIPTKITVVFQQDFSNVQEVLDALKAPTMEI